MRGGFPHRVGSRLFSYQEVHVPPETAVADTQAAPEKGAEQQVQGDAAVAPGSTPVSPVPATEPGGDEQAPAGGNEPSLEERLREKAGEIGLNAKTVSALLKALPAEERQQIAELQEAARSGEQRALTQLREAETAVADRDELFSNLVSNGSTAKANLQHRTGEYDRLMAQAEQLAEDGDDGEAQKLARKARALMQGPAVQQEIKALEMGTIARVAQQHSKGIATLLEKHKALIGELSPEESKRFKDARYDDARQGGAKEYEVLIDLVAERSAAKVRTDELPKAKQQAQAESTDTKDALETMLKLQEVLGNLAPNVNGARPANTATEREQIQSEMNAIDVTTPDGKAEWDRRQPEFQRRLRALDKK